MMFFCCCCCFFSPWPPGLNNSLVSLQSSLLSRCLYSLFLSIFSPRPPHPHPHSLRAQFPHPSSDARDNGTLLAGRVYCLVVCSWLKWRMNSLGMTNMLSCCQPLGSAAGLELVTRRTPLVIRADLQCDGAAARASSCPHACLFGECEVCGAVKAAAFRCRQLKPVKSRSTSSPKTNSGLTMRRYSCLNCNFQFT